LVAKAHGKGEGAVQARARRRRRAREVRIPVDVGDPGRLAALPYPAGQPDAPLEAAAAARRLEGRDVAGAGARGLDAAQAGGGEVDPPDRAPLEAQALADDQDEAADGRGEVGVLGEDAGDGVLRREPLLAAPADLELAFEL